ncbi:HlyC/CorC family transporter [bacterium]|nr:MAG: HlyC/CorC family transporter [bacterium]
MGSTWGLLLASFGLILGNAFFVAAEYALVSTRKSAVEGRAKKGNSTAKLLLAALDDISPYVAGVQIAITMLSLAIGLVSEPFFSDLIQGAFRTVMGEIPRNAARGISVLSLILITYITVVFGELLPKYVSLRMADTVAMLTIRPLHLVVTVLKPLVWLVQRSGAVALRPFGINVDDDEETAIPKEELLMLVRSGGLAGTLDARHAELVTRALRLDTLSARDVMIHRLDMKWIDASLNYLESFERVRQLPYTRMPVCRGDIDEVVGVLYIHDFIKARDTKGFTPESIARPAVMIPETLSLERMVETMRSEKTQMLLVVDEYGGTSGLVTLEDVVEEVFGELEDRLESDRPPLEEHPGGRISARADLRYDELITRLRLPVEPDSKETLATILVNKLDRVPRPGDMVEIDLGTLRVENMARRRITRVSLQLTPELVAAVDGES